MPSLSSRRRRSASSTSRPAAPPPAPVQGRNESMMGELGASIKEGFGFGAGVAMAQRMVHPLTGPFVIRHETVAPSTTSAATEPSVTSSGALNTCDIPSKAFVDCLNKNGSDISNCQFYMNLLKECHGNTGAALIA